MFVLLVYMHNIMQVETRSPSDIPTVVKHDTVLAGNLCNQYVCTYYQILAHTYTYLHIIAHTR